MNVEQTIDEIERLERIFAEPDTRPLSAGDLSAGIENMAKCSRTARGFAFGSSTAFAAGMKLQ